MKITFNTDARAFVTDAFGKKQDEQGYLVEKDTGQRVLTPEGEHVKAKRFAGIIKGSELYIKNDIASLVKLSDRLNSKPKKG